MTHAMNPAIKAASDDYRPDLVRVVNEAILAADKPAELKSMGSVLTESILKGLPASYIPYFTAMDVLNWQFWDLAEDGRFQRYGHNGLIGALAMQDGFHRAWTAIADQPGVDVRDIATQLRDRVRTEGVAFMLGAIPAAEIRRELLIEVLDPERLVAVSKSLHSQLVNDHALSWCDAQMLAETFPLSYGDRYLKKAQLTLMFIASEWNATQGNQRCRLDVSLAADYQLPKVMRAKGFLEYSPEVDQLVKQQKLIDADGTIERAIRSATIIAGNALASHFHCEIEELDFWLWANRNAARDAPFHLTRTTAY